MLLRKFYEYYGIARICAIAAFLAIILMRSMPGYCYVLDVEFRSPEVEAMERECNDRKNERAYERHQDNDKHGRETSDRDIERASDWHRDHSA